MKCLARSLASSTSPRTARESVAEVGRDARKSGDVSTFNWRKVELNAKFRWPSYVLRVRENHHETYRSQSEWRKAWISGTDSNRRAFVLRPTLAVQGDQRSSCRYICHATSHAVPLCTVPVGLHLQRVGIPRLRMLHRSAQSGGRVQQTYNHAWPVPARNPAAMRVMPQETRSRRRNQNPPNSTGVEAN